MKYGKLVIKANSPKEDVNIEIQFDGIEFTAIEAIEIARNNLTNLKELAKGLIKFFGALRTTAMETIREVNKEKAEINKFLNLVK